jgi:hypothetical protein
MRFTIFCILITTLISSCTKPNSKNETTIVTDTTAILTHEDSIIISQKDSVKNIEVNHEFAVKFQDFEIILDSLEVWDGKKKGYLTSQNTPNDIDTTFIVTDIGYNFEGNTFTLKLINNDLTNIKIKQSFEASMFLQGISEKDDEDDPLLDLFSSKRYLSEWKILKKQSSGKYKGIIYSEDDISLVHKVTEEDVHGEIMRLDKKKYDYWIKFLEPDYPFAEVRIDYYFLKITGLNKKTGKLVRKIIVIELPSGC